MAAQTSAMKNPGTQIGATEGALVRSWLGALTLFIVTAVGVVAFLAPFWSPVLVQGTMDDVRAGDSPIITGIVIAACFVVLFVNLGPALSSKAVALLGVLVSINVVLRAFDQTFLPPGEFSPVFLLITLVGYVFGAQMGFLMGALTLLSSALFTGGVGPWLPFQMFAAGWMGMSAAWVPGKRAAQQTTDVSGVARLATVGEAVRLAVFGFFWGLLYGVIMNLYFWPFLSAANVPGWEPGTSLGEAISRYIAFYLLQSAAPDLMRAVGNALLMLLLALPLLRVFRRFRTRFTFTQVSLAAMPSGEGEVHP